MKRLLYVLPFVVLAALSARDITKYNEKLSSKMDIVQPDTYTYELKVSTSIRFSGEGAIFWADGSKSTCPVSVGGYPGAANIQAGTLPDSVKITTGNIVASGTASDSTYLRGDGSWAASSAVDTDCRTSTGTIQSQLNTLQNSTYTVASINHDLIQSTGTNSHAAIDTHVSLTQNSHGLTYTAEGTGGGLDADTVDGSHANAFAGASHTHGEFTTIGVDTATLRTDVDGKQAAGNYYEIGKSTGAIYFLYGDTATVISAGVFAVVHRPAYAATLTKWTLSADVSSTLTVTIYKCAYADYAGYTGTTWTEVDSISLSGVTKNQSTESIALAANDVMMFKVTANDNAHQVSLKGDTLK